MSAGSMMLLGASSISRKRESVGTGLAQGGRLTVRRRRPNVVAWSPAELFDVEPDRFDELLELNLKTAWLMSRHAVEVMGAGGAIVNIASVATRRAGTVYGLGKAALESMTQGAGP